MNDALIAQARELLAKRNTTDRHVYHGLIRDWLLSYHLDVTTLLVEQAAEITRLNALMSGDKATVKLEHDGFQVQHWAARLMAMSFADTLGDAENYVSLELTPEGKDPVVVTARRKCGKLPEDMLKAEITRLRALLPHTADGVLIADCETLYCPRCNGPMVFSNVGCFCDNRCFPEGAEETLCLSKPKETERAQ